MKAISEKVLLVAVVLLLLVVAVRYYAGLTGRPESTPSPTEIPLEQQPERDDLPDVDAIEFTDEELEMYYAAYDDPYVQHVRVALNGYLDGTHEGISDSDLVVKAGDMDGMVSGLDSFDRSYYESLFVVFSLDDFIFGGKEVMIMFQERPDRIFGAWVYDMGGAYELRGFWEKPGYDVETIEHIREAYREFLEDEVHAL